MQSDQGGSSPQRLGIWTRTICLVGLVSIGLTLIVACFKYKSWVTRESIVECGSPWGLAAQQWTEDDQGIICNGTNNSQATGLPAIPKVAMLFLSVGPLRHETLWTQWFKLAHGQAPLDCLHGASCNIQKIQAAAQPDLQAFSLPLFSVYLHLPPDVEKLPETSLFSGAEISERLKAAWGSFELAQITKNLLSAALEDVRTQRFITVSEACIPLYPPQVIYSQLMYNEKSIINACTTRPGWGTDGYRWTWRLNEATGGKLMERMWRKNHQWLGLTRRHARIIVEDNELAEAFRKHCYSGSDPDFGGWWRTCITDEHLFSTLLAYKHLEQETDCYGELTHTEWCPTCPGDERNHPRTYKAEEVNTALIRQLRQEDQGCNAQLALQSGMSLIGKAGSLGPSMKKQQPYLLPPRCPLLARKFSDDAVLIALHTVLNVFSEDERSALSGGNQTQSPA